MNVIEMPNEDLVDDLSIAEINCLGQLHTACLKYKRRGKCKGKCEECPWGSGKRMYDKLSDRQKVVVQVNEVNHYCSDVPSLSTAMDNVTTVFVYLFCIGLFIGCIMGVVWLAKQIVG